MPASEPVAMPVDAAIVQQALRDLKAALVEDDVRADELFRQHANLLHAALGEGGERLRRLVENYDYAEALELLRGELAEAG